MEDYEKICLVAGIILIIILILDAIHFDSSEKKYLTEIKKKIERLMEEV